MKQKIIILVPLVLLLPVVAFGDTDAALSMPTLSPPIVLYELHVWRDGGSLGFEIGDQSGGKIKFFVDGKIESATVGWFFFNTIHTDYEKGRQLPLGEEEEKQLLNYLSLWLDSKFDRKKLEYVFSTTDFRDLTQDQFNAFHVKRLIDNRDKTIEKIRKTKQSAGAYSVPAAAQP
jgi:hypothetical protein